MLVEFIGGPFDGKEMEIATFNKRVIFPVVRSYYKRFEDQILHCMFSPATYEHREDDKLYFIDTFCKNAIHSKALDTEGPHWIAEAERFTFEECPDCQEFIPTGTESLEIE